MYACQPGDKRLAFKHRSAGSRHDIVMVVKIVRMTKRAQTVLEMVATSIGRYRDLISQQTMSSAQPIRCSDLSIRPMLLLRTSVREARRSQGSD